MKFEELLSSKYIMFAFIGLCAGILALTAVEVGDDFIPALVLSFLRRQPFFFSLSASFQFFFVLTVFLKSYRKCF